MQPTDLPVDIGPRTLDHLKTLVDDAHTIFWNGPLGVWEIEPFATATRELARALIERVPHHVQRTVICGDSLSHAIRTSSLPVERLRHLTSGGEAALQLLAGHPLPSVAALDDALGMIQPIHRRPCRILLAVDESDSSLEAAGRIGGLVEADGAEITLLYVRNPGAFFDRSIRSEPEAAQQRLIEQRFAAERVFSAANAALAQQGLISHRQLTVEGNPPDEILKYADEMDVDLIAMGSRGKSGLRSVGMEGASRKVIDRSRRPVLIVRAPREDLVSQKAG
jgi:nucleotide-binding universal stress UspA family protein